MSDSLRALVAAALGDMAQTFGQTGALLARRPSDDMLFAQADAALAAIEPLLEAMRRHIWSYEPGSLVGSELNVALHLRDLDGEIWEPWCVPGDPVTNEAAQFAELVEMVEASGTHVVVPVEPTHDMVMAGGDVIVDFDADFKMPDSHVKEAYRRMISARPRDADPTDKEV